MLKYGILMHLPEGKRPGFYAQLIKGMAGRVPLFDRDRELLIVSGEEEAAALLELLGRYEVEAETLNLLLLPSGALRFDPFPDCGFSTREGRFYVYADQVKVFRIQEEGPDSEPGPALAQMREHLVAEFGEAGARRYVVEEPYDDLIRGIASAYRCTAVFEPVL